MTRDTEDLIVGIIFFSLVGFGITVGIIAIVKDYCYEIHSKQNPNPR